MLGVEIHSYKSLSLLPFIKERMSSFLTVHNTFEGSVGGSKCSTNSLKTLKQQRWEPLHTY